MSTPTDEEYARGVADFERSPWAGKRTLESTGADEDAFPDDDKNRTEPTESEISHAQLRINIQAAARRRQSSGGWDDPPDQGDALHQYLTKPDKPDWQIKELMVPNARVLVTAQWKTGKTTLGLNLVHSLVTGSDFLRKFSVSQTVSSVGYWNHEVDQTTFIGWLHDRGLLDPEEPYGHRIYPLHTREFKTPITFENPAIIDWSVKWLSERKIETWMIDTFSRLYTGSEKENDEITRWWDLMNSIAAQAGVKSVVVFHHTGYSEDAQDRGRGGSALGGLPDAMISFRHKGKPGEYPTDNIRYLKAIGRNVSVSEFEIDYAGDTTRELFATGTTNKRETPGLARQAFGVAMHLHGLEGTELNKGQLCKDTGMTMRGKGTKATEEVLDYAESLQWITKRKSGSSILFKAGPICPAGQDDSK